MFKKTSTSIQAKVFALVSSMTLLPFKAMAALPTKFCSPTGRCKYVLSCLGWRWWLFYTTLTALADW